jgi:hypothetical protein
MHAAVLGRDIGKGLAQPRSVTSPVTLIAKLRQRLRSQALRRESPQSS